MPKTRSIRIVLVTAPPKDAEKIARTLLIERLIACANLLPNVTSLYWWDGKIQRDGETLILMKTPARNVKKLLTRLKQLHSYSVPEFLTLSPIEANPNYVAWVLREATPLLFNHKDTKARRH